MPPLSTLIKERQGTILDVRSAPEFQDGHFPGAINIPVDQIPYKVEALKQMAQPFICYCRSGARSSMATMILKSNGFDDVFNAGGLQDIQQLSLS
jgi:phage shock protein E